MENPLLARAEDSIATSLGRAAPELAIVVPTFNESGNVRELVQRLAVALRDVEWEVVFVDDDSPDATAALVRSLAQEDPRVRCIQRIDRRGLSTACIEGMLATSAPFVAVIDADMQHDERLLPKMLQTLKTEQLDIVVGSRYVSGGGVGDWQKSRATISRIATRIGHLVVPATLSDPMSGFFMLARGTLDAVVRNLSGLGFKILMDIFASAPRPLRFKELAYEFRARHAGESKLDSQAAWDYGMLLLDKLVGRYVPVRFISFALIGGVGMVLHLALVSVLYGRLHVGFIESQTAATLVAMTFNYALNNALTYRDRRLAGWRWLRGWLTFVAGCSIGGFANVGIAAYLFNQHYQWVLAAIAGILVGAVWNYAITFVYTWGKPSRAKV